MVGTWGGDHLQGATAQGVAKIFGVFFFLLLILCNFAAQMDTSGTYTIDLQDLFDAPQDYCFELGGEFFDTMASTLLNTGQVSVRLHAERQCDTCLLDFAFEGEVTVPCDRCLDDMQVAVEGESQIKVLVGGREATADDEVAVPADQKQLDVSWLMYEMIALEVPLTHVHEEGQCNAEMMKTLAQHMVGECDEEHAAHQSDGEAATDPRWNGLKKIIDNN